MARNPESAGQADLRPPTPIQGEKSPSWRDLKFNADHSEVAVPSHIPAGIIPTDRRLALEHWSGNGDPMDGDETLAFRARGVTKVYGTGPAAVHALRGVDLDIPRRDFVVLLGPSGSGKSTLLNIMGGLDRPSAGSVDFQGERITDYSDSQLTTYRRSHVGFVFQLYNLMPSLTARENVELVTEIARHPMSPEEALEAVGLGNRLDHFPAQLSGGEQQRVAIAQARRRPLRPGQSATPLADPGLW